MYNFILTIYIVNNIINLFLFSSGRQVVVELKIFPTFRCIMTAINIKIQTYTYICICMCICVRMCVI